MRLKVGIGVCKDYRGVHNRTSIKHAAPQHAAPLAVCVAKGQSGLDGNGQMVRTHTHIHRPRARLYTRHAHAYVPRTAPSATHTLPHEKVRPDMLHISTPSPPAVGSVFDILSPVSQRTNTVRVGAPALHALTFDAPLPAGLIFSTHATVLRYTYVGYYADLRT